MGSLHNQQILITAGPTYEAIDPVRFIGNRSSGRLGYALAEVARAEGAKITLISGPTALTAPPVECFIAVESAQDMYAACLEHAPRANTIIMAAAVADYRPAQAQTDKIKKTHNDNDALTLELVPNPDILTTLCQQRQPGQCIVGFALETSDLIANAEEKLRRKGCDIIIANSAESISATQQCATLLTATITRATPYCSKAQLASTIWEFIIEYKRSL